MSEEYGLVVPFVACASNGGPYDDTAFVAGCQYEAIRQDLRRRPRSHEVYVYPELRTQLDLLSMEMGYDLTTEAWNEHPDQWMLATFRRR